MSTISPCTAPWWRCRLRFSVYGSLLVSFPWLKARKPRMHIMQKSRRAIIKILENECNSRSTWGREHDSGCAKIKQYVAKREIFENLLVTKEKERKRKIGKWIRKVDDVWRQNSVVSNVGDYRDLILAPPCMPNCQRIPLRHIRCQMRDILVG